MVSWTLLYIYGLDCRQTTYLKEKKSLLLFQIKGYPCSFEIYVTYFSCFSIFFVFYPNKLVDVRLIQLNRTRESILQPTIKVSQYYRGGKLEHKILSSSDSLKNMA